MLNGGSFVRSFVGYVVEARKTKIDTRCTFGDGPYCMGNWNRIIELKIDSMYFVSEQSEANRGKRRIPTEESSLLRAIVSFGLILNFATPR